MLFKNMLGMTKNSKTMGNMCIVGNIYTCISGAAEWGHCMGWQV
jgi:hypothetical protein